MNNEEVLTGGLYAEWLMNTTVYEAHLENLNSTLKQLLASETDQHEVNGLLALQEEVLRTKADINRLYKEVEKLSRQYINNSENPVNISVAEMIARSRLRDKIRKSEQVVFVLRYNINRYLQKAS